MVSALWPSVETTAMLRTGGLWVISQPAARRMGTRCRVWIPAELSKGAQGDPRLCRLQRGQEPVDFPSSVFTPTSLSTHSAAVAGGHPCVPTSLPGHWASVRRQGQGHHHEKVALDQKMERTTPRNRTQFFTGYLTYGTVGLEQTDDPAVLHK